MTKQVAGKGHFAGKIGKLHPSVAKAKPLFCCIFGTTKVVPFQNLCREWDFFAVREVMP